MSMQSWLRQPTTITGLGTVAGATVAVFMLARAHDPNAAAAIGALAFAAVHLLVNDNTVAAEAQQVATQEAETLLTPPAKPSSGH